VDPSRGTFLVARSGLLMLPPEIEAIDNDRDDAVGKACELRF
jgi:hypothetical protein